MTETALLELDNAPDLKLPPTQDQLPCDDGIPMETARHKWQMELLVNPLTTWLANRDAYVGGNMFVYFSPNQVKNHDFRGPDVFVVLDVPKGERKSWVVWEEGKGPDVVIELLSESTAAADKQQKKEIYQRRLRVPEYFWFDPFNPEDFAGFAIRDNVYEQIMPNSEGKILSQQLGLVLVPWAGQYGETNTVWLRWATLEGELLPTDQEIAEQERQRAVQAELLLEQERQRSRELAEKLKALSTNFDV